MNFKLYIVQLNQSHWLKRTNIRTHVHNKYMYMYVRCSPTSEFWFNFMFNKICQSQTGNYCYVHVHCTCNRSPNIINDIMELGTVYNWSLQHWIQRKIQNYFYWYFVMHHVITKLILKNLAFFFLDLNLCAVHYNVHVPLHLRGTNVTVEYMYIVVYLTFVHVRQIASWKIVFNRDTKFLGL